MRREVYTTILAAVKPEVRMAVITVAVIILVGQICAARFARVGGIIAIIT